MIAFVITENADLFMIEPAAHPTLIVNAQGKTDLQMAARRQPSQGVEPVANQFVLNVGQTFRRE